MSATRTLAMNCPRCGVVAEFAIRTAEVEVRELVMTTLGGPLAVPIVTGLDAAVSLHSSHACGRS